VIDSFPLCSDEGAPESSVMEIASRAVAATTGGKGHISDAKKLWRSLG
jgi:hypothetical protein